jgi:hypothetical protein
MSDNGHDEAFGGALVTAIQSPNIASELIGQDNDIRKLFLSLTYFMDVNEANDFCTCLYKCRKHALKELEKRFLMMIAARVSVKGYRSAQIVDVLTQIQRMVAREGVEQDGNSGKRKGIKTPSY